MKTSIKYFALTFGLLASVACKKSFLVQNDPNSIALSSFFRTESDVSSAVNGCYQSLRSSSTVGEDSGLFTDERSDDTGRNDAQSNAGEPYQFHNFSLLPSNTYLKAHWVAMYQTIYRCNVVLANSSKVTFAAASSGGQYSAEVKFIRAMIYFDLVRKWGDIPLVTNPLATISQVTANTYRQKQDSVFAQIVRDLTDVVNSPLPNLQPVTGIGHVSKAAGNALLGKVYLTMALTLNQGNRTTNLNLAKSALLAAYNLRTFGKLSEIPYTDVFDVNKKSTCPELILQIVNKQGDINFSSDIAAINQAKGDLINSLKPSSSVGGNVTHDLVNDYEPKDLRGAFSIKFDSNAAVKDWYITKYRDVSAAAGVNGYGGNNTILLRYADVILMLAEVSQYLGDNASAIAYLDLVRARAGMPSYETTMLNTTYNTKYPNLMLAILHERRVELAFEHQRWFDLIRTFSTPQLVAFFQAKSQANYGTALLSNFTTKDRFYPIPYDEFKLDPVKMYQNPGY